MAEKKLAISEAVGFGWKTALNNLGFFVALFIIVALIYIVPGWLKEATKVTAPLLSVVIGLVSFVLIVVVKLGLLKISLRFVDNEKGRFEDLWAYFHLFFKFLGTSIIYGLIVLAGLILLIVPGIIWAIQFGFFPYFMVEKNSGPMEALKKSSEITKGNKWNLFLLGLLLIGINILGALCLLIGLIVTAPLSMLAVAFIYRKLSS